MVDTSTSHTSSDQPTQKKKVFWPNVATIDGVLCAGADY